MYHASASAQASSPDHPLLTILLWLEFPCLSPSCHTIVAGFHFCHSIGGSTDVEAKQSQDLGDLFQISVRVPKQSKGIRSHGDWVIAFGKTIQAISFALPGRHSEYEAYQAYMLGLFVSITPSFHSRVIELDRAIRLRAANQKHLRLSDFARFEDLRTYTSFGVGASLGDGGQGPR